MIFHLVFIGGNLIENILNFVATLLNLFNLKRLVNTSKRPWLKFLKNHIYKKHLLIQKLIQNTLY